MIFNNPKGLLNVMKRFIKGACVVSRAREL